MSDFAALRKEWNDRLRLSTLRKCEWCHKDMNYERNTRKFCGVACRVASHRARLAERKAHEGHLVEMTESLGFLPTWSRDDMRSFFGMHVLPSGGKDTYEGMPDPDEGETYLGLKVIGGDS